MRADGGDVDAEKADGSVVIYDPERGESEMITPSAYTGILSIGEVVSAEDFEAEIQREARATFGRRLPRRVERCASST